VQSYIAGFFHLDAGIIGELDAMAAVVLIADRHVRIGEEIGICEWNGNVDFWALEAGRNPLA
jgi:hypothetical protein|tara:strand:+ start:3345 stop:3530 length:186 start_codon:yes stop_codon:yes gene_type:complete